MTSRTPGDSRSAPRGGGPAITPGGQASCSLRTAGAVWAASMAPRVASISCSISPPGAWSRSPVRPSSLPRARRRVSPSASNRASRSSRSWAVSGPRHAGSSASDHVAGGLLQAGLVLVRSAIKAVDARPGPRRVGFAPPAGLVDPGQILPQGIELGAIGGTGRFAHPPAPQPSLDLLGDNIAPRERWRPAPIRDPGAVAHRDDGARPARPVHAAGPRRARAVGPALLEDLDHLALGRLGASAARSLYPERTWRWPFAS